MNQDSKASIFWLSISYYMQAVHFDTCKIIVWCQNRHWIQSCSRSSMKPGIAAGWPGITPSHWMGKHIISHLYLVCRHEKNLGYMQLSKQPFHRGSDTVSHTLQLEGVRFTYQTRGERAASHPYLTNSWVTNDAGSWIKFSV